MEFCGLVLARGGSKGVINKHLRLLGDKPLIRHVVDTAKKVLKIYVSSDSQEILNLCCDTDTISRPPELAQDDIPSIEAAKHALQFIDSNYVVLLNACTPFVEAGDITKMMELAKGADSVVSLVEDFSCHSSKVCMLDGNRVVATGSFKTGERQKLNKIYKRNAAIYVFKREVIETGTLFGKDLRGYVMPKSRSLDINDEWDFNLCDLILKYG